MLVVPMGRCRLFLGVLVLPIVLMRVGDIPESQWSILFTSPVDCSVFPLIFRYSLAILSFVSVSRVTSEISVSLSWHLCLVVLQE